MTKTKRSAPKRDKRTGKFVSKEDTITDTEVNLGFSRTKVLTEKQKSGLPRVNRYQDAPAEGSRHYHANAASLAALAKKMTKEGIPVFNLKSMTLEEAQAKLKRYTSKDKVSKVKPRKTEPKKVNKSEKENE